MRTVTIRHKKICLDGKEIPLISGEVHYWRLNPRYWSSVLELVEKMGLDIISTYVPWGFHEIKRGEYDFTGKTDPARDLRGFLELTHRRKLWVIIRPGPYIYSEWPHEGVPAYTHKYHRLHPKFQELAIPYIKKVCSIIRPYLATQPKGHILMLQADNEIDPWPDLFGSQYGLVGKPGLFQDFLKRKYDKSIRKLNDNWGTRYRKFEEAGPFIACMLKEFRGLPLKGDRELRRNLDYFEFKYFYSVEYAKWIVKQYRASGIDVPVYLNLYPFFYAHDWAAMESVADMTGIDLYPSNEFAEDEHEQRKFIDKVRYMRTYAKVPFIAEFEAGTWHMRHYESGALTPNHYRLIALSAMLGGVAGWNWYMLVNRDNWYMSPINEWGRPRGELYNVFKDLVTVFRKIDPPTLEKLCDVSVTFNTLQYAARTVSLDRTIPYVLHGADIDYELYDANIGAIGKKIIFYSGNQWMGERAQRKLLEQVKSGSVLVAFQDFPRKDDNFRDCNLLGFEEPTRTLFEFKKKFTVELARGLETEITSSVYVFSKVKGKRFTAVIPGYGRQTIGYMRKVGRGTILHLGVEPDSDLVFKILKFFRIPLHVISPTREVKTALFRRKNKYYLIAVNNGNEDKSATVVIHHKPLADKKLRAQDLFSGKTYSVTKAKEPTFSFEIGRKDGKMFGVNIA
ncbi:MAG: beta-galactosidase [Candidatus Omnitrophica bacterium]|nr:beta-galactosidase [Candidatus Omnitrophota bacterium]